jgi:hypothetical protein
MEQGYREALGVSAIGAEPGSRFLTTWLDAMPSVFNPSRYVAHSTLLARHLALRLPSLVRVLEYHPIAAFYMPLERLLARFIHRAPEAVVLQRGVGAVFGGVGETLR